MKFEDILPKSLSERKKEKAMQERAVDCAILLGTTNIDRSKRLSVNEGLILRDLLSRGFSIQSLSDKLNLSFYTVQKYINDNNLKHVNKGGRPKNETPRKLGDK